MDDLLTVLEPEPSIRMDEHEAQSVLQRTCPVCRSTHGFSCTIPVDVDGQVKRQQVLEFHAERLPAGQEDNR